MSQPPQGCASVELESRGRSTSEDIAFIKLTIENGFRREAGSVLSGATHYLGIPMNELKFKLMLPA